MEVPELYLILFIYISKGGGALSNVTNVFSLIETLWFIHIILYFSVTFTVYLFKTRSVKYTSCTCASQAYVSGEIDLYRFFQVPIFDGFSLHLQKKGIYMAINLKGAVNFQRLSQL